MERAMMRAMSGQKVVDKMTTHEQMDMLELRKLPVGWLKQIELDGMDMSQDDGGVLRNALDLKVSGKRKQG